MFSANYQTSSNWKKNPQRAIKTINKILKQKKTKQLAYKHKNLITIQTISINY